MSIRPFTDDHRKSIPAMAGLMRMARTGRSPFAQANAEILRHQARLIAKQRIPVTLTEHIGEVEYRKQIRSNR